MLYLNPLSGAVGLLRWALVGTEHPDRRAAGDVGGRRVVLLLFGLFHFRRHEREFADII